MTADPRQCDELRDLLWSMEEGSISVSGVDRIDSLVRVDTELLRLYVEHMRLFSDLRFGPTNRHVEQTLARLFAAEPRELPDSGIRSPQSPTSNPFFIDTSPAIHYPLSTIHSFVGSALFSYLVAALIVGLGLLIASAWKRTDAPEIARQSLPPAGEYRREPESKVELVGRITGLVDCKWEKKGLGIGDWGLEKGSGAEQQKSLVFLGDQFALASGLMEITYATGAKVILQGPCTYEVESPSGGFLSLGKLTARVEKNDKRETINDKRSIQRSAFSVQLSSNPQSLISNPSLSTIHYPLFTIKTPTATVTDLGTEFGVEVNRSGATESFVFRGAVKVRATFAGEERAVVVGENESVFVEKPNSGRGKSGVVVHRAVARPDRFVRQISPAGKPWPMQVLAWFRMGEDDPAAVAGQIAGERTINHGHSRNLERYGSPTYSADTAAPGSTLAMSFTGAEGQCFHNRYLFVQPTDNFILEAWVYANHIKNIPAILAYNGHTAENGYGLILKDGKWQYFFGSLAFFDSGMKCELGKWTHLALVREDGKSQLWVNGQPTVESRTDQLPNRPNASFMIGGNPLDPMGTFDGQIDEVRFSEFYAPFCPEMLLWSKEAMQPAASPTSTNNNQKQP